MRKPKRSARAARKAPTLEEVLASAGRDPAVDRPAVTITPAARAAALNLHNPEFSFLLQRILEVKAAAEGQSQRRQQQRQTRQQQQAQSKQVLQPQVQSVMDWKDAAAAEQQQIEQQIEQQVEEEAAPWGPAGKVGGEGQKVAHALEAPVVPDGVASSWSDRGA